MFERIVRSSQHGRFDANGESWKRAGDTGKLNCAPNRLRGQGSTTTGGEEALCKVTTIDSAALVPTKPGTGERMAAIECGGSISWTDCPHRHWLARRFKTLAS